MSSNSTFDEIATGATSVAVPEDQHPWKNWKTSKPFLDAPVSPKIGVKYDQGKLQWSLLPWEALAGVVQAMMHGVSPGKYEPNNWRKGMAWTRYLDANQRHLLGDRDMKTGEWLPGWIEGIDDDPESGVHHVDHAIANLLMLRASIIQGYGEDDRYGPSQAS